MVGAEGEWSFWRFLLRGGGQVTEAAVHLTPENSTWIQAVYRDIWLNGAVYVTFSGGYRWNGAKDRIRYHNGLERFYRDDGSIEEYQTLFYKMAATVKDAQLFFEMDNALSAQYRIIHGYYESIRRVRFGVNWKFWN
jgi:hypothetical protein